jgi:uncharacterized protein involved in type VI secretion and phage assembly
MDTNRFATLTGDAAQSLLLVRLIGQESLGRPFEYNVDLASEDPSVDLASFLGQPMTVRVDLPSGDYRYFCGIVTQFKLEGSLGGMRTTTPFCGHGWPSCSIRPTRASFRA